MLKKRRYLFISLMTLALMSCHTKPNDVTVNDTNTGWIVNQCLAIHNMDLKPGTAITAISLNGQPLSNSVTIQNIAQAENCNNEGSEQNTNNANGLRYYTVNTPSEFGLGIGTLIQHLAIAKNEDIIYVDFDKNGTDESVTFCSTSEGLSFDIWSSTPYTEKPLWTAYYHLGYDVERNCP